MINAAFDLSTSQRENMLYAKQRIPSQILKKIIVIDNVNF